MKTSALSLFGSKVGRRIFGMMAVSALVPLILALVLSQFAARSELDQTLHYQLRDNAKTYGMGILAVLQQHAKDARQLVRRIPNVDAPAAADEISRYFSAAWKLSDTDSHRAILGSESLTLDWQDLDLHHLAGGQSQLLRNSSKDGAEWLLITPNDTDVRNLLAFRLPQDSVWRPSAYLPPHTLYCVFSNSNILIDCTAGIDDRSSSDLVKAMAGLDDESIEWNWNGESMLSASWTLFLGAGFSANDIKIVSAIDKQLAYGYLDDFQAVLLPLVGAVVAMVILLSLRLMRKNLVPLQNLTQITEEFAAGKLKTRIELDREDEFGQLGSAFNNMAARLDRQFDTLKTMSGVDNQILAGESIDQICKHFLRETSRLFSLKFSATCIIDPENPGNAHLTIHADDQIFRRRITLMQPFDKAAEGDPEVGDTAQHTPVSALDPAVVLELRTFGSGRTLAFPIRPNGEPRGTVILNLGIDTEFDDEQIDLCVKLISRLAIGIASFEREETLYKKSHYDDLTQLPNRQLLKDRLAQCLVNAEKHEVRGALLFIDLDRFKEVNDVYGHSAGDKLLLEAATRIRAVCDSSYTVARLGGDEFVVLLPEIDNHSHMRAVATALIDSLSLPFEVAGREQVLGASVGISIFPDDGKSVEITLRNADTAMYRAKSGGRRRFEFYSEEMNAASQRRLMLERELRNAIRYDELQIYLQPQVRLPGGQLRGAECLLRWEHKSLGWISPAEFIPIAEDAGLIVEMGRRIIERACKLWRKMVDDGLDPGVVSVNVSGRELEESEFAFQIINALETYSLDPSHLEIEITESIVAKDKDLAMKTMTVLRNLGVSIAMDDFGTGYSSLSFLSHLPLHCLKVDQSFVAGIGESSDAESLCRTIVSMAHELGKTVIAEGIETEQHAKYLSDLGCECGQGYFFAKPMPEAEFHQFVAEQQLEGGQAREIA